MDASTTVPDVYAVPDGEPCPVARLYGVDFSGASDAWRKIWVAEGANIGDRLWIDRCRRLDVIVGSERARSDTYGALRECILESGPSVWGMDFPFGLPAPLVNENTWDEFILAFPSRYPTVSDFRRVCWEAAGGRELRRATDIASRTPLSPYNLRLYPPVVPSDLLPDPRRAPSAVG